MSLPHGVLYGVLCGLAGQVVHHTGVGHGKGCRHDVPPAVDSMPCTVPLPLCALAPPPPQALVTPALASPPVRVAESHAPQAWGGGGGGGICGLTC